MTNQNLKFDEKSCGIILFNEDKEYLLLQYPQGHYSFIKGHVEESDASELETAAREAEEETGITDITFFPGFREEISYKYNKMGKISHKQVVYFLAETPEKEVTISHEHRKFVWLSYDEAFKKVTFDNDRHLLSQAKAFLTENYV